MHVVKPCDQRSLTSHMPGRRTLKMTRPAAVGTVVIVKTLGTRWLNLHFFIIFLRVLAHGPYRVIAVKDAWGDQVTLFHVSGENPMLDEESLVQVIGTCAWWRCLMQRHWNKCSVSRSQFERSLCVLSTSKPMSI